MKKIARFSLVFLLTTCSLFVFGQQTCKVLNPRLVGNYDGRCKKGLANGKGVAVGIDRYEGRFLDGLPNGDGTYTWDSGNSYTGDWISGQRHGIGKYFMHLVNKDSIQDGLWQNDVYMGPRPPKPSVMHKTGVDRYSFTKDLTSKNRVLIDLYMNGGRNIEILNFIMSSSSGYQTKRGESVGYDEVTFPVNIRVQYTTFNKLHTANVEVVFDFTISEPGDWTVKLNN